ncbi:MULTISPECIES: transcription elongation factor GreA [Thermodesulfobacterium]|jgi:transcription elongation factor GreA|uniref:Transcription elongation factor GreA n=2 Tax=Thermodesulfobacterium commune TaxID=1741 RepID=A0A075WZQ2_9BACT|nr:MULTISPECIES: transcription elongation factor GreA [Thermodesulfobacterium]KUJ97768.1 MAG: Transcription elongation factor GreA [Thermodesulfobacterium sp. 37_54]KUK19395.1 MAG: Transcription elongation factor GreA [Thermodesulfobacterium commune]AIH04157.1 transcription elongation factor GreA [Thermodesulfobacterium commune DSM 2178]KUK37506.1 MAG: Transcription elongation factor GreA [Thermodesulfobacterium commune]MBZ4682518.1 transcription elongation factor GreA [Thermodesulfobacterium 
MNKIPFTPEGLEKIKKELEYLIKVERRKVIKAIEEARAHGDLSENAEYEAAKERQAHIEGKIQELSGILANAEVIPPLNKAPDRVQFGVKVKLLNLDTDEIVVYKIVGPYETDPSKGIISVNSPIAKALIGKEIGDVVQVKTPSGIKNFEILDIEI